MVDLQVAQKIVDLLNEAVKLDKPAIAALIGFRVPCNDALAEHPTIQVGAQHGGMMVGWLGILNGIAGFWEDGDKKDWGAIAAEFEDDAENDQNNWKSLKGFKIIRSE